MNMLATYDPLRGFGALQQEINRLFDRTVDDENALHAQWPMRVDVREDADAIVIRADLPGMKQEQIDVRVDNGRLTISGERRFEDAENKENYHRVERYYGRFSRTFQLPGVTDMEHIDASYVNGVLEVRLPKREEAKPRSIEVKVH
ncbi:Hsp20/alpha crystallin family protein [Magnetofaba australis]|uniref:Putative heat shock protein Hsp20 n=1 Tax=Magnetofaba australis IT-1 TaxID=1434232 RepID=A0A1Y2K9F0_9PROT|nr:Hsp20/alpha crystallin family protein [Magnetofaba australis]OSM07239.1 putative heat shock protein Hsp20 [Magnetofaba australis IT-1]